jgi:cobalt-zinc-cadmium efflux system membrane fusion protein
MKQTSFRFLALGCIAALMLWLAGCSADSSKPADSHAGHDHGHEGHAHNKSEPSADGSNDSEAQCAEHGVPEDECGICNPELAEKLAPGESLKVRLPGSDSAKLAGLKTAPPTAGTIAEAVECYAEITFNQDRFAHVAAPVGGIVQEVNADLGSPVKENQAIARIWSASIAEGVAKAVLSHQTLERERRLRAQRVTSEKDLQQAEAEHQAACQQLRLLGFAEEQIEELAANPREQVLMNVKAPFAGEIIERTAVRGALVEPGTTLFTVADLSSMWAMLSIPETLLAHVRTGQEVELLVPSLPDERFTGKLTWISAVVDERTRMARARVELSNPNRVLKAKMFAQARILTRSNNQALLLPDSSLQRIGSRDFVFVRLEDDLFAARAVRAGARRDGLAEIIEGLQSGEAVAISNTFALKSAFLISRLGAGCADD